VGSYFTQAVELQFDLDPSGFQRYRNLNPIQWSGPEAIWLKDGNPLFSPWQPIHQSQGTGFDKIEPQNIKRQGNVIAYYDNPGPSMISYFDRRPSRLYVVQNFTGWIVGEPLTGGSPQRLCDVVAWYSVIHLADGNWGKKDALPDWQRMYGDRSGTGWADPNKPPSV
jgi:hypothetical protein